MPRKPRFFLPNIPVHVVIRGNARRVVFAEDADRKAYLGCLKEAAEKYKVGNKGVSTLLCGFMVDFT